MNIKISDSWLREFLKTKATPAKIAEVLSLTSVSVERLEKHGNDYLYDIEVTTNRPDLMSIIGIAREAAAVLPEFDINAELKTPLTYSSSESQTLTTTPLTIINDPKLAKRICAVVLEVKLEQSPKLIKDRLEATGIRSLNNVVDVTNYVMREIGHPTHVMDYDRLSSKTIKIRESKKGETITTLDERKFQLAGGDIVAESNGEIVDLLGIMGLLNSVVTPETKQVIYFINNNDPHRIRKTSMSLALRSEAAVLNEKGIDTELAYQALFRGIELFAKYANGRVISKIIDIYPHKPKSKTISITSEIINNHIGISVPLSTSATILKRLGFGVETVNGSLQTTVPSWRVNDIEIPEDLLEEIARVYGYHRLPSLLPPVSPQQPKSQFDEFFWENKAKQALKYWGFAEVYTYSMVSADLFEGPLSEAVKIQNPLTEEHVYMRRTLVPSLLNVARHNENREEYKIFEVANVYHRKPGSLPDEILTIAAVLKKPSLSFYEVKGVIEQLLQDFGIHNFEFKNRAEGGLGADVYIDNSRMGDIEILDNNLIDFELNFEAITKHATDKKTFHPVSKFPPVIEDISLIVDESIAYKKIIDTITKQSSLVKKVELFDMYKNKKTFRIYYQSEQRNLTNEEVAVEREKIYIALEKDLRAKIV